MAEGDKYITCDNAMLSLEQLIRMLIIEDSSGKPIWATNLP